MMLLHAQIESNKRKTVLLVGLFLLFFAAVGAAFGVVTAEDPVTGIVIASVIGVAYVLVMTRAGTQVVMAMNRAREIKSEDENPFLWNTVEALSIAARVPMPKVYIIDDPSPNAFAAGMSPQNAAVAVTTGLLDRLNRHEIEGVLAHEVAHIQNYDVRLATTAVALVAVVGILSDLGMRLLWHGGGSRRRRSNRESQGQAIVYLVALVFLLLSPLIAVFLQLAISRNREYLADASGAELCRNPGALASALRKIAAAPEPVQAASRACAALYISDPTKKRARSWASWWSTHPPVEERIRRLEQMM
ncbi:MAG: zinc metalloprotease HtpX [Limnochordales bacterium]